MKRCYTPEMRDFIATHAKGLGNEELAVKVNEKFGTAFSARQMQTYKHNHHLHSGLPRGGTQKPKIYPMEVCSYIMQNYKGTSYAEMVLQIKEKFGLEYTTTQMKAFYGNRHLDSGLTGRFEPGHVPFNKGMKGVYGTGCEKGWFKKGGTPPTTKPLGYEYVNTDGYTLVKVRMEPSAPGKHDRFVPKHRYLYEKAYGPIPPDCAIMFKDGNRQNLELSNLVMVSRAELRTLNKRHLISSDPELTETGIALVKLRQALAEVKRKERKNDRPCEM